MVIVRDLDEVTHRFLDGFDAVGLGLPVRKITVGHPGSWPPEMPDLPLPDRNSGDIDDDTAPHPDWIVRIVNHFIRDYTLGGLGGRDAATTASVSTTGGKRKSVESAGMAV